MRGRHRRWTALATALAASGWLSTLTPATATAASGSAPPPSSGSAEVTAVVTVPEVTQDPAKTPEPTAQTPAPAATPAQTPAPAQAQAGAPTAQQDVPAVAEGKVNCKVRKCIALTFDDGPMSSTSKLLKILAQRKVKATFFLIGQNAKAHPGLVRQELAAGHEIGNHSYTHADLARASASKVRSELSKTQSAIHKASGFTPRLMRPPYGATDSTVTAVTRKMKLAQILWAVDPLDWKDRNSNTVERRVVGRARPGYIILMHDIHPTTVAAVPNIIKRLAAKGYVFVTVSQLFGKPLTPGKKYTKR